jgi:hypothetical protein
MGNILRGKIVGGKFSHYHGDEPAGQLTFKVSGHTVELAGSY